MPFPLRGLAAVLSLCLLCAPSARAELTDEIQVYTDGINAPGEFGLELHVNTTPKGRRAPDYPGEITPHHGWRITPEFSYGITRTWEAGLYLPMSRDASGKTELAGMKVRLKWLPVYPGEGGTGWFFGANGELSRMQEKFSESRTSAELRLMGGWRSPDWLFAVNPVFGWNLSDGLRSSTADLGIGAKVARTLNDKVALGFEYYNDLATTRRPDFSGRQPRVLYGVIDAKLGDFDLNFGIGHGLTSSADRWTVKAILGVPL